MAHQSWVLLLLLHVRFFCVIFDGSRRREREIVDVDKHFLSFFFVTCVRIFASSCCSWDRQCLSVCIYQTRSCRFCLFLALFVSPRELIRRRKKKHEEKATFWFSRTNILIYLFLLFFFVYLFIYLISNRKCVHLFSRASVRESWRDKSFTRAWMWSFWRHRACAPSDTPSDIVSQFCCCCLERKKLFYFFFLTREKEKLNGK